MKGEYKKFLKNSLQSYFIIAAFHSDSAKKGLNGDKKAPKFTNL